MERTQKECESTYHRYFALEPFAKDTGEVTIVLVCTQCGRPLRYDFSINEKEAVKVTE